MVDNGVLRLNEAQQVHKMLNEDLGVNLTVVDASDLFLSRLQDIEDPEQKRKIIGNTFINVFEAEAAKTSEEEQIDKFICVRSMVDSLRALDYPVSVVLEMALVDSDKTFREKCAESLMASLHDQEVQQGKARLAVTSFLPLNFCPFLSFAG